MSGLSLITVLGQAAAIVVVVAVLASMTLLPALLGALRRPASSGCGSVATSARRSATARYWQRWGERLARRPGVLAVASVALLLALSAPVLGLGLGLTDQSSSPEVHHGRARPTT